MLLQFWKITTLHILRCLQGQQLSDLLRNLRSRECSISGKLPVTTGEGNSFLLALKASVVSPGERTSESWAFREDLWVRVTERVPAGCRRASGHDIWVDSCVKRGQDPPQPTERAQLDSCTRLMA